ncbi:probable N-acetyltransferase camello isoform X3 [Hyla sarda]|uniref:probable N-acetyltransferase camello isoform X3 n=1 Tax=Hyla sarda TaxID=327740 RepID=UPI0024C2A1BF|nr:probable N-acetyltransferase camello isoform X3 [Hyla sarda]XP_056405058.1 probable N-acetyltransferase camello isoform X3 [Hyla sarda]
MFSQNVRLYKDSDYHKVREMFTSGCFEHTTAAFCHALRLPHNYLALLIVFLLPLLTTGSFVISIVGVVGVVVALWFSITNVISFCVKIALEGDLKDIERYYTREDHCFWVAESAGEVVGTVAAVPLHKGGKTMELKRMSVASTYRGKGVGKVLCRTMIDFAQQRGCNAVILFTTSIQADAVRLYEKMGFRHVDTSYQGSLRNWLLGFIWVTYRYDIPAHK